MLQVENIIFIKQLKDMCSREKENKIMGLIDLKEKVIKILGEFLGGNEKYVYKSERYTTKNTNH